MEKQTKRKNSAKEEHTPEQLKVIRDYEDAVEQKIINFLKKARNEKIEYVSPVVVTKMKDTVADYILEKTGIDTHGNSIILRRDIVKGHMEEHFKGINGKSPMTDMDFSRIKWVIDNADEVAITKDVSNATRTREGKPAPHIMLRKRIDGHYYIVEAISDGKKKNNIILSAFLEKIGNERGDVLSIFKEPYRVSNASGMPDPSTNVQNAHELSSSNNNSISNSSENVNVS